ncbi:hypothetical protein [Paenibacillus sp. FSL W7-1332]|uniref:hypothetical protein n=1 Tax=Paenibacillus sp. FSL W7-1332 TaxID=2921702 RepID=UPI0030CD8191
MDVELYLKHSDELEQSFEYLYSENFIVYLSEKEDVELFKLLEEVYKQHTRVEELFQGQMELLMEKMRVNSSVARLSAYSSSPVLDAAFFDEKR